MPIGSANGQTYENETHMLLDIPSVPENHPDFNDTWTPRSMVGGINLPSEAQLSFRDRVGSFLGSAVDMIVPPDARGHHEYFDPTTGEFQSSETNLPKPVHEMTGKEMVETVENNPMIAGVGKSKIPGSGLPHEILDRMITARKKAQLSFENDDAKGFSSANVELDNLVKEGEQWFKDNNVPRDVDKYASTYRSAADVKRSYKKKEKQSGFFTQEEAAKAKEIGEAPEEEEFTNIPKGSMNFLKSIEGGPNEREMLEARAERIKGNLKEFNAFVSKQAGYEGMHFMSNPELDFINKRLAQLPPSIPKKPPAESLKPTDKELSEWYKNQFEGGPVEPEGPETIAKAALRHPETGKVYEAHAHYAAIAKAAEDYPDHSVYNQPWEEGFTTNKGRFVSREEAADIHRATVDKNFENKNLIAEDISDYRYTPKAKLDKQLEKLKEFSKKPEDFLDNIDEFTAARMKKNAANENVKEEPMGDPFFGALEDMFGKRMSETKEQKAYREAVEKQLKNPLKDWVGADRNKYPNSYWIKDKEVPQKLNELNQVLKTGKENWDKSFGKDGLSGGVSFEREMQDLITRQTELQERLPDIQERMKQEFKQRNIEAEARPWPEEWDRVYKKLSDMLKDTEAKKRQSDALAALAKEHSDSMARIKRMDIKEVPAKRIDYDHELWYKLAKNADIRSSKEWRKVSKDEKLYVEGFEGEPNAYEAAHKYSENNKITILKHNRQNAMFHNGHRLMNQNPKDMKLYEKIKDLFDKD